MSTLTSIHWRRLLRRLLWLPVATYLVLPVFLYGFTPMGSAVVELAYKTFGGQKAVMVFRPARPGTAPVDSAPLVESTPARDLPMTVLLLGYGGPDHDGAYLTDSMILAVANPKTKSLTLLSIPRDTLVNLPLDQQGGVQSKINTAYAYGIDQTIYSRRPDRYKGKDGGGILAKDVVSNVVGIPVRYYLALDFGAFERLVDEVGGVEVDVPAAFASWYPNEDKSSDEDWIVVRFEAGKQTLNGDRALKYARAREAIENMAEGSDFARSRRQREIMQAFRDKLMSPSGLLRIPGVLSIAKQRINTDLEVPGLGDLQQLLADWRGTKINEVALTSDNYLTSDGSSEKGYYLSSVAGQNNWSQIHTLVNILIDDPELGSELARTKVIVRNGSGRPEKGTEMRAKLQALGFAVAPVETVPLQPTTRIEDMSDGQVPRVVDFLKSALKDENLPVQKGGYPSLRVALVLGQDQLGAPSITPTATPR